MPDLTITGWMREAERMALRRWAFGLDVLELGSYLGLSTSQLLTTAKSVAAVDTFDGRGTPEPRDCRHEFHNNMKATGHYDFLATWPGEFAEVLPKMRDRGCSFDLVFIDGAHDFECVQQCINLSLPLLRPGGAIAFHDYGETDPGVVLAVNAFTTLGWCVHEQVDSLVLLRKGEPTPRKVKIRGVIPHRDGMSNIASAWAMDGWLSQKYNRRVTDFGTSVLPLCFNRLWCDAMNEQRKSGGAFTHFCMLHNDVVPEHYWLDKMIDLMHAHNLDMISAVVPLKDSRGLTSTGVENPEFAWSVRRLSLKEIYDLPPTFTTFDLPGRKEGEHLLLNSGCWVMRFTEPWYSRVEGRFGPLAFRQQDAIGIHEPSGDYTALSISEDWDFSRQLISRGCRIGATREVSLYHERHLFHNQGVWGTWATDEEYIEDHRQRDEYEKAKAQKIAETQKVG